jgi:hypothetical protein
MLCPPVAGGLCGVPTGVVPQRVGDRSVTVSSLVLSNRKSYK